jgi:hypothetical protein
VEDGEPLNGAARVAVVVGGCEDGCLDPTTTGLHGEALDLEEKTTR